MIESLIDRENKLIMDWSPKAGCTILVKMFFKNMGLLEDALVFDPWIHNFRQQFFYKDHPISISDYKKPDYYKFKVVRNPYSRAVSSYVHVMKYPEHHRYLKRILWRWDVNISFKKFVGFLSKMDIKTCEIHYSQQKKYFEYEIENCFDRVIKLENINSGILEINKYKGLKLDLSGLTSEHHIKKNENIHENVAGKCWTDIKDNIPLYPYFYDDELIEKVYKIYKADFESYNYTYDEFLNQELVCGKTF